ncbi:MAG TPA: chondroitinase-B domain-containing protein [Chthoniobacteraceae bacterium]|nr:chondroitinase-B domain-containing protein [Chthoniobacteraceae bacterium]
MLRRRVALLLFALLLPGAASGLGAEYFVGKKGSDRNDGRSVESAFLTIGKGVEALAAGDTLTIAPGEYFEAVYRENLGSAEAQTVIRAAIPGTVLLQGDVPLSGFKKAEGYRFIYVADFEGEPQIVNETDTLTMFDPAPGLRELEYHTGLYYHDAEKGKLYISTSDLKAPEEHRYTVSITHASGLHLVAPQRVLIEGLAATGFNTGALMSSREQFGTMWGFYLKTGKGCIIRNCTAYLNGSGIGIQSNSGGAAHKNSTEGGGNLVERCTAYGNYSRSNSSGGNIAIYFPDGDEIRDCTAYRSVRNGIRLYGGFRGDPSRLVRNLAWANQMGNLWVKGANNVTLGSARENIGVGNVNMRVSEHGLVGGKNRYANSQPPSEIWLAGEKNLDRNAEFADPYHFDFRLQSTSRFRGAAPGGKDQGPFQYQPNIFYVSPDGDDADDGLSVRKAWKSLERALRSLRPGDTVYLEAGLYPGDVTLKAGSTGKEAISIKGRGAGAAVLTGSLEIDSSHGLRLERLGFRSGVKVRGGSDIAFNNCRFNGPEKALSADGIDGLRVTHGSFTGFSKAALELGKDCTKVFLQGNLFDNRSSPAVVCDASSILYSDYNSYHDGENAWSAAGSKTGLKALQATHDVYSQCLSPQFVEEKAGPRLANAVLFAAGGGLGTGIGIHQERKEAALNVFGPVVHSVSDTTANLEWWTSHPATFEVAWGRTPECENIVEHEVTTFGSLSLTGLEPGTPYYFVIRSGSIDRALKEGPLEAVALHRKPISFTTEATARTPKTYYVSNEGSDANTGLSREEPWQTVSHAAERVHAGDTVLVAAGRYQETVRIRTTGTPTAPITFAPLDGGRVEFDGKGRSLISAFSVQGKSHLRLDGFYFKDFSHFAGTGVVDLYRADDVRVTRCFSDGRGTGYAPWFVKAVQAKDLLLKNCVIMCSFHGLSMNATPGLTITNNVFVRNMITSIVVSGTDEPYDIRNNLFTDSLLKKINTHMFEISGTRAMRFDNNAFLLRKPDKPAFFFVMSKGDNLRMTLAEYSQKVRQAHTLLADPKFAIFANEEPAPDAEAAIFPADRLASPGLELDFRDLFATNPEVVERGIGLEPGAFADFPRR